MAEHSPVDMDNATSNISNENTAQIVEAAPYALAHLLPEASPGQFTLQMITYAVLAIFGVITNTLSIFVLTKGKLLTNWTNGMILNLSISDLMLCLVFCMLYLPTAVRGW